MKLFGFTHKKERPGCAAVIVAAGSSRRMEGVDKIVAQLRGMPVIAHTIRAFEAAECIDEIVLVTRPGSWIYAARAGERILPLPKSAA